MNEDMHFMKYELVFFTFSKSSRISWGDKNEIKLNSN